MGLVEGLGGVIRKGIQIGFKKGGYGYDLEMGDGGGQVILNGFSEMVDALIDEIIFVFDAEYYPLI